MGSGQFKLKEGRVLMNGCCNFFWQDTFNDTGEMRFISSFFDSKHLKRRSTLPVKLTAKMKYIFFHGSASSQGNNLPAWLSM